MSQRVLSCAEMYSFRNSRNARYATLSSGMPWNIPLVNCIFSVYTRAFIPCHRKCTGQHNNQCDIRVAPDDKVGYNTSEYIMNFLFSDWLYFTWHGTNEEEKERESLAY